MQGSYRSWKVMEFKVEIFQIWKIMENDPRYSMYSKLWNIVRMLLVLSHGQDAVERGFSINKQSEEVHLLAETFVAREYLQSYEVCVWH